jgi:hypothetical protein
MTYKCWLCHDSGWLCDSPGTPGVAILTHTRCPVSAPTEEDIRLAYEQGLNPRSCHASIHTEGIVS